VEVCPVRTCVVILSGHSLFAEGVASQLRQHPQELELEVVDVRQPDAMARIIAAQPAAVILDATDSEVARLGLLSRLPLALPGLKVICLDSQQEQIQVITSEQLPADQVRDLLDVI
jgi:DNA-binding NarL/FixJ family response regulator